MNYTHKILLTFATVAVLALLNCSFAYAQTDSLKIKKNKISKNDYMLLLAYDDTTKAIAELFVAKRKKINRSLRAGCIATGISVAMYYTGGLMMMAGENVNPVFYIGFPIMFLGGFGTIGSIIVTGINLLRLSPYTFRKYIRLLEMHRSGIPLPEFYAERIYGHN